MDFDFVEYRLIDNSGHTLGYKYFRGYDVTCWLCVSIENSTHYIGYDDEKDLLDGIAHHQCIGGEILSSGTLQINEG